MQRRFAIVTLIGVALFARCATTVPPAPERLSESARHLVDPRTGYPQSISASWTDGLGKAWAEFRGARITEALQTYQDLARRDDADRIARLGLAAVAIEQGHYDYAATIIDRVSANVSNWAAVANYRGEIAVARGDLREAWKQYSTLLSVLELHARAIEIRAKLLDSIENEAKTAAPADREALLREALGIDPASVPVRLSLINDLIAMHRWNDATEELQPLITSGQADLNAVQAALAEIDVGRGHLREAIRRYERIVDRTGDAVYRKRLGEVRQLWQDANLPPHYQRAVASPALTRADLAVIAFWRVDAVRFAQRVGPPPIAVDIANVAGRDEFVRCLALGIFPVDPVTREANPSKQVTVASFLRVATKLLTLAHTPSCAANANQDDPAGELEACGVNLSGLSTAPDASVDGHTASSILESVAQVDRRND